MEFRNKHAMNQKSSLYTLQVNNEANQEKDYKHEVPERLSHFKSQQSRDIDETRQDAAAYEYLCHLEEARLWMQECIQEKLPYSTEFENRLRNGVYLAKLGNFIAPHVVPLKKIFDINQEIYDRSGLHYRHTDNINFWILSMKAIGLSPYFYPNSFDVYGKKNMPKVVYCLHGLSLYLHRCGIGMRTIDLIGKIQFTDEEIFSVSKDFAKFGIQLPAFGKIGGILSHDITPGSSIMNAAIIAINIAICQHNSEYLLGALMNPNAQLQNIFSENAEAYQKALLELKSRQVSVARRNFANKKHELCWDFLTQRIIQNAINSVNIDRIFNDLRNAILFHKAEEFLNILKHPLLSISDIVLENMTEYIVYFEKALTDSKSPLCIAEIQSYVAAVNHSEFKKKEIKTALINFNNILNSNDYFASFNILKSLVEESHLHNLGIQFYHLQFRELKILKGGFLDLPDILEKLPQLTALLEVSIAVIQGDVDDTFRALSNTEIKCWELYDTLKKEYFNGLKKLKQKDLDFLSADTIKSCIDNINAALKLKENSTASTKSINLAISLNDKNLLIKSLLENPSMLCVNPENKNLYMSLFLEYKMKNNQSDTLHRDEIQKQINVANKLASEAKFLCTSLANINMAIEKEDGDGLFNSLKVFSKDKTLCLGCKEKYVNKLIEMKNRKSNKLIVDEDITHLSWIKWKVSPNATFYFNVKTLETAWDHKDVFESLFLQKEEICEAMFHVESECHCMNYEKLDNLIVSLQAYIRGVLFRKKFSCKKKDLATNKARKSEAVVRLQSFFRMFSVRKKYLGEKAEIMRVNAAARIIQRAWHSFRVNKNLNLLIHSSNPPLSLMQRVIQMLEISDDYSDEFKLQTIKGKAVQTIRYNQSLLKEIDELDVKIGLLIRNRITLEDLLKQKKKNNLKDKKNEVSIKDMKDQSFIFSKKYNTLIELYESLLYLLQTKPVYLSHLIISLPSNQATSLIESIIFSLYNFGSTPREEYLLLKMLSLTLEEDIQQKGDNLSDIIKGENIIMKIIISFYRKNYWHDCLKKLLQSLILEVLNDKLASFNLDPVELYKVYLNEVETQTGEKSLKPYEVTIDEALYNEVVNSRFYVCVDNLLKYSLKFCEIILNAHTVIPYGIRYICKVLKLCLQKKYPESSDEELYKIIGNFLYYRYINPAIIAPDAFDIITIQHNEQLAECDRFKLSTIAKFLHFSVSGKLYTEEMGHLMCLNPYLRDCHENFISFFDDVCELEPLEEHFNINDFSEAIVNIPEVYMSLNELNTLYKLISEREYSLAPDSNDVLHEIIKDFKVNDVENMFDTSEDFLNTEICLSLKSKYDLDIEDENEEEETFVETKFLITTLLSVFSNVNNVNDLYEREPTFEEEMKFEKICFINQRDPDLSRVCFKTSTKWKTLSALQSGLQINLNYLESLGCISGNNNYSEILNSIAKDIVNKWRHRINRNKDILKLLEIQKQLDSKTLYYLEKLDFYYRYINVCLENMKIGKKNKKFFFRRNRTSNELKCKKTIKLSASKLHEKGILLAIKDLDVDQFKNVHLEISPAEDLGIFTVKAKLMGIPLEMVDVDIQELLDRQYQGIAEMTMFDCIKINNNLLLHFLNSKFYGENVV